MSLRIREHSIRSSFLQIDFSTDAEYLAAIAVISSNPIIECKAIRWTY